MRLKFQDDARFGRMVRPKRCWAPASLRPAVGNGYEREFLYVYGAVSLVEGELDWRLTVSDFPVSRLGPGLLVST